MASLIERFGGVAQVSPSMREVAIGENREAIDFAHRLLTGQIDIVIFMTGVGVRHLLAEIERHVDRAAVSGGASPTSRPSPAGRSRWPCCKELGLEPTLRVPEPNTWREVLATIDAARAGRPADRRPAGVRPAERQPGRRARSPRREASNA